MIKTIKSSLYAKDSVKVMALAPVGRVAMESFTQLDRTDIHLTAYEARELAAILTGMAEVVDPQPEPAPAQPKRGYVDLGQQAQLVHRHMARAGSISAREAMNDHGITSATLARRICDIEEAGIAVSRVRKTHPITRRRYTRYSLAA